MVATTRDHVIDITEVMESRAAERNAFSAMYYAVSRRVKRMLSRGGAFLKRTWRRISPFWQYVLKGTAMIVGWFAAYFVFYVTLLIAAYYSLTLMFVVLAIWAALFCAVMYKIENREMRYA